MRKVTQGGGLTGGGERLILRTPTQGSVEEKKSHFKEKKRRSFYSSLVVPKMNYLKDVKRRGGKSLHKNPPPHNRVGGER